VLLSLFSPWALRPPHVCGPLRPKSFSYPPSISTPESLLYTPPPYPTSFFPLPLPVLPPRMSTASTLVSPLLSSFPSTPIAIYPSAFRRLILHQSSFRFLPFSFVISHPPLAISRPLWLSYRSSLTFFLKTELFLLPADPPQAFSELTRVFAPREDFSVTSGSLPKGPLCHSSSSSSSADPELALARHHMRLTVSGVFLYCPTSFSTPARGTGDPLVGPKENARFFCSQMSTQRTPFFSVYHLPCFLSLDDLARLHLYTIDKPMRTPKSFRRVSQPTFPPPLFSPLQLPLFSFF